MIKFSFLSLVTKYDIAMDHSAILGLLLTMWDHVCYSWFAMDQVCYSWFAMMQCWR